MNKAQRIQEKKHQAQKAYEDWMAKVRALNIAEQSKAEITSDYIRSRIEWDGNSFRWKPRAVACRQHEAWNTRYAGTVVGHVSKKRKGNASISLDKRICSLLRVAYCYWHGVDYDDTPSVLTVEDGDYTNLSSDNLIFPTENRTRASRARLAA